MIQQNSSTTLYQHLNLSYNTTEQVSVANFCHFVLKPKMNLLKVMGQTPSYRTSIKLEHHFSIIERTQTCAFVHDRTRTPYFWLRTIEHRTSNIVRPITNVT